MPLLNRPPAGSARGGLTLLRPGTCLTSLPPADRRHCDMVDGDSDRDAISKMDDGRCTLHELLDSASTGLHRHGNGPLGRTGRRSSTRCSATLLCALLSWSGSWAGPPHRSAEAFAAVLDFGTTPFNLVDY